MSFREIVAQAKIDADATKYSVRYRSGWFSHNDENHMSAGSSIRCIDLKHARKVFRAKVVELQKTTINDDIEIQISKVVSVGGAHTYECLEKNIRNQFLKVSKYKTMRAWLENKKETK